MLFAGRKSWKELYKEKCVEAQDFHSMANVLKNRVDRLRSIKKSEKDRMYEKCNQIQAKLENCQDKLMNAQERVVQRAKKIEWIKKKYRRLLRMYGKARANCKYKIQNLQQENSKLQRINGRLNNELWNCRQQLIDERSRHHRAKALAYNEGFEKGKDATKKAFGLEQNFETGDT